MITNKKIKKITDASIIVAIYIVFLLISKISGLMIEYDLFFIIPIPIVIYSRKYSIKEALIPFFATLILSFFLTDFLSVLLILFPGLLCGIIYGGIILNYRKSDSLAVVILTFLCVVKEVLVSCVFSSLFGIQNIFFELDEMAKNLSILLKIQDNDFFFSFFRGIVPSIIFIIAIFESIMIIFLSKLLLKRIKIEKNEKEYKGFTVPKTISFLYIGFLLFSPLFLLFINSKNLILSYFSSIFINLVIILMFLEFYFFYIYFVIKLAVEGKKLLAVLSLLLGIILMPISGALGAILHIFSFEKKNR